MRDLFGDQVPERPAYRDATAGERMQLFAPVPAPIPGQLEMQDNESEGSNMSTTQQSAKPLPEYPCDICGQEVQPGERYTVSDGGLTVEHRDCTRAWFRCNFGRETLS